MEILVLLLLIPCCNALQPTLSSFQCEDRNPTFTANASLRDNFQTLSIQLQRQILSSGIFASCKSGVEPNEIHALALCRLGLDKSLCSKCIAFAANQIFYSCQKNIGISYHLFCHVVLSDRAIQPVVPSLDSPSLIIMPKNTIMNPIPPFLNFVLFTLTNRTADLAANNMMRVACSIIEIPNIPNFFSYLQCSPDLSKDDCMTCFDIFPAYMLTYFVGYTDGAIVRERCTLVFSTSRFYKAEPMLKISSLVDEIPSMNVTGSPVNGPPVNRPPPKIVPPVNQPPPKIVVNSVEEGGNDRKNKGGYIILRIVLPIALVILITVATITVLSKRWKPGISNTASLEDMEEFKSLLLDPSTIRLSTKNYAEENILGRGGFGNVYKGLMPDGMEIAVKRLKKGSCQGLRELKNELVSAAKLQHRNLIKLIGASIDMDDLSLVYEFIPNNTLDSYIFDKEKRRTHLSWTRCQQIICGVARGLKYLHDDCHMRVIHRDLKPSNILLESDFNPKISDFGLASVIEGHSSYISRHQTGTRGYISPEHFIHGYVSNKLDVFSFGIILVEILTGRRRYDNPHLIKEVWENWMNKTIHILDPTLQSTSEYEALKYLQIALICTQDSPRDRPAMSNVIMWLQEETAIPAPLREKFIYAIFEDDSDSLPEGSNPSSNNLTISDLDPR